MDYGSPFADQCQAIEDASVAAEKSVVLQETHVPGWHEFRRQLIANVNPVVESWLGVLRAEIAQQPDLAPLHRTMRSLAAVVGLTWRHPLGLRRRFLNFLLIIILMVWRVRRVIIAIVLLLATGAGLLALGSWLFRNWDRIVSAIRLLLGMP